ncbi:MAG: Rpn family recombination-promoting nuclease/putative transposase [Lachnospiraceae bacterium]|nr:Rpn family recombination-promoting nuclease/putative transposase [Lachnospiraceae bacterium]
MTKSKSPISSYSAKSSSRTSPLSQMLQNSHGRIPYNMTNDYMFRAVLQSNNKVLRGLICSLLHLEESEVYSVEITNPIILGETITEKEIRLDINVKLNNQSIINLEMQVANKLNWPSRSLLYLSRSFDNLNRGYDYLDIQPAIHIGFLDYTLFHEYPEFYAVYKLINIKKHYVYSDNFVLSVVNLSRIDLATDEDKEYHIDSWARLFKATTWEEIKNMADTNEYIQEASKSIFQFNTDEQIRKLCRDRIEYHQDLRNYERAIARRDAEIIELRATIDKQNTTIDDLNTTIDGLNSTIDDLNSTIDGLHTTIDGLHTTIDGLHTTIDSLQSDISKLYTLAQK